MGRMKNGWIKGESIQKKAAHHHPKDAFEFKGNQITVIKWSIIATVGIEWNVARSSTFNIRCARRRDTRFGHG